MLKIHLYPFILRHRLETQTGQPETDRTPWGTLIATFLMIIGFFMAPLLLARFLPAEIWFVSMISLTSGVSLSEVILYVITHIKKLSSKKARNVI